MASLEILQNACVELPHAERKMFGGYGFFAPNGGMFAGIVDDDRIILKLVDGPAKEELCTLGTTAWTYAGSQKPMTMRDWILVPDAFYDDPEALASWARRAHTAAPAKAAKKPKPSSRKPAAKPKPANKAPAKGRR